jgi:hypothetical protein
VSVSLQSTTKARRFFGGGKDAAATAVNNFESEPRCPRVDVLRGRPPASFKEYALYKSKIAAKVKNK